MRSCDLLTIPVFKQNQSQQQGNCANNRIISISKAAAARIGHLLESKPIAEGLTAEHWHYQDTDVIRGRPSTACFRVAQPLNLV
jgi:hypothetical protein